MGALRSPNNPGGKIDFFCAHVHALWPKMVPKLPANINDLADLPQHYKETSTKQRFLASSIDVISKYLLLASLIGLTILSKSEKWWCDGTFKTAPKFYYQHYIIH